jgi:hypothetical protein
MTMEKTEQADDSRVVVLRLRSRLSRTKYPLSRFPRLFSLLAGVEILSWN